MKEKDGSDPGIEWMIRLAAGDNSVFENIVNHYKDAIYAFIYRFGGGSANVEDLAQEVFLRVYRARTNYRPTAKFSTWLYKIASNLCLNAKRNQRKPTVSLDVELKEERLSPKEQMEAQEVIEKVREALQELPEKPRIALIMHRYHAQSYEEIGQALGMSEQAIKSMMLRTREKLKQKLLPFFKEEVSG